MIETRSRFGGDGRSGCLQVRQDTDEILAGAGLRPIVIAEHILDQCLFTPYHHEDVGAMIRASDSRLYAFSTDYPHIEGGRDPIASFDATMADCTEAQRAAFYAGNFLRVFGE
ncbi:hypothetical protein P7L79_19665 [Tistrella mobilis]|uniref:hypothetical protein n=1 Tax=Tistrella mobilis TaxID=171437 RepID=UPI0035587A27